MYNILSLLIGVLITIMIAFNAKLSDGLGNYSSLIVIHFVGLIIVYRNNYL